MNKTEPKLPLFSDILKKHGVYEKFLANLSVDHYNYDTYAAHTRPKSMLNSAFMHSYTPEGSDFWNKIYRSICSGLKCINDVRAPDDLEYWDEQFNSGNKDFYISALGLWDKSNITPPSFFNNAKCYAKEPIWLARKPVDPVSAKEPTMDQPMAYYKRSGEPWTMEELGQLPKKLWSTPDSISLKRKWVFYSQSKNLFMWSGQENISDFKACQQVAFEDAFPQSSVLHQKWKTLYSQNVQLQWWNSEIWENLADICPHSNVWSWNEVGYKYRRASKEQPGTASAGTTNPKETPMSNNTTVEVKVNGVDICSKKATKAKTSLQISKKRDKVYARFFAADGSDMYAANLFNTEADAYQLLNTKEYIGCTVIIYNQSKTKKQKIFLENA